MTRSRELADLLNGGQTITTADNDPQLILKSTDADAGGGPVLQLFRDSASPADDDVLGQIKFHGRNDAAEEITYGKIDLVLRDASDGTEDSEMRFLVFREGANPNALKLGSTETVFNDTGNDVNFRVESDGNANMLVVDAGNNCVGIGTSSPSSTFQVLAPDIGGSSGEDGFAVNNSGRFISTTDDTIQAYINDSSASAGTHNYLVFRFQGTTIGDIDTTDNTTIRYNTFTGAHWGQFSDHSQPDIKLGTVMSTINEMCNWTAFEYTDSEGETQKTDIAGTYEIGSTHTIYIDEDGAQATGTAISHDTSGRIAKVKVSDTASDRTVYGVFAGHYKDGDSSVESLGLGSIRIGSGVTVAIGDLLESAGDGTARPQTGDTSDLIKSSTIAKVTSTTVSHTYDDGSYLVPCVLMAG